MRIRTSGDYERRTGLHNDVERFLDENTRNGMIDSACGFTRPYDVVTRCTEKAPML